jgi:selenocysteine-specific elongation factor
VSGQHFILGTAGHIDHGKTALVRALSGIECDTHAEERQRGITIHLGFAHLELDNGISFGIVDVPGHAAFVRTMVAGASGIDSALLVIAADSGVMPQTREHLQIMDILGVRSGIIVLTKTDLVDEEMELMAREEIGQLVKGTFLEQAAVIGVSSKTGSGLEQLRAELTRIGATLTRPAQGAVFRLFIDRFFTVKGFGPVVTGSVISGTLTQGDSAWLLPGQQQVRIRRIERHGKQVESVCGGERASLNLVGVEAGQISRGMVVADRPLRTTSLVDARIRLFEQSRGLGLWSHALFYLGTIESKVRIHLLDTNSIAGGEEALVQIHLEQPLISQAGDRFVIRSSSSDRTLGGGEIIDPFPLHHRRRPEQLVQTLRRVAQGDVRELLVVEALKRQLPLRSDELAEILNLDERELQGLLSGQMAAEVVVLAHGQHHFIASTALLQRWRERIIKGIEAHHSRNPLLPQGRQLANIMGSLTLPAGDVAEPVVVMLLEQMSREGIVRAVGKSWALGSHEVNITAQMQQKIDFVKKMLQDFAMQVPLMSQMVPSGAGAGIDEKELQKLLRFLVSIGEAYQIEGEFIAAEVVDSCRSKLVDFLNEHPEGITVAQFRDIVGGNRKICLLLLARFDSEGTTVREEDKRYLTKK